MEVRIVPKISFTNQNIVIKVENGVNLREAAIKDYISIYPHIFKILNCRGRGLCVSCVVEVVAGEVNPPNETELKKLKKKREKNPNLRLGCQINVNSDLEIKTHV